MSINLVELAKGLFTKDVLSGAGASLGESEGNMQKAINAIIPSVLLGLFNKANAPDASGRDQVISAIADSAGTSDLSGTLRNVLGNGAANQDNPWIKKGLDFLHNIFGGKTDAVAGMISGYSGIKPSSATTLMSAATPALLALVGNNAQGGSSNPQGIWSLLLAQKDNIISNLPSGLNLAGIPVLGSFANWFSAGSNNPVSNSGTRYIAENSPPDRKKGGGWLLWLLLLVLIALALWYFMGQKGCNNQVKVPEEDTAMMAPADPSVNSASTPPARESIKVQLPNGSELDAYKGGIEDMLVTFLKTDYRKLGPDSLKNIWFDFDNLNFETGSAKITAESQVQISNLTAILKAFPEAKLKIGGYTDKTGNEPGNVKLSGERAKAVQAALTESGVGAQIENAEGYGSKFARFPADAPETDRVKDRHVSVSVRG
jgi:outer membrane protein OmpA-like peptidoglycan-associated protein